jgi:hypothetical protein
MSKDISVRVIARFRPLNQLEKDSGQGSCVNIQGP